MGQGARGWGWGTGALAALLALAPGPAPAQDGATPAERRVWLADLDAFRQEVQKRCSLLAVKRIDWNGVCRAQARRVQQAKSLEEFLHVMQDVVAQLRDGHAYLEPLTVKLAPPPAEQFPGIALAPAPDDQVVVVWVAPDVPDAAKAVRPGMLVQAIDGEPAWALLEGRAKAAWEGGGYSSERRARYHAYRLALAGPAASTVAVTVVPPEGDAKPATVTLTRDRVCWHDAVLVHPHNLQRAGNISFALIDETIGYVQLYRMDTGRNAFDASLTTAMQALKDTQALVVDLRGNRGGGIGAPFIDTFVADPKRGAGGTGGVLGTAYAGRLAVLIDPGTFSAGEGAASLFRERTGARLFGETTAGSSSKKTAFQAPSGLFQVWYSWRGQTNFGQRIVEFYGVDPHQPVPCTPATLFAGKDPVIEAALAWLRGR